MNKKYLLLIGGIFIISVFIIFLFTMSSPQKQAQNTSYSPSVFPSSSIAQASAFISQPQAIQATTAPENLTPDEVARKFYSWYITYPGVSALSKGAYSTSIYLSDDFKQLISEMGPYDGYEDPVFCSRNKLTNFTVLPATTASDGRQSAIIQSAPEGKKLYQIKLVNINNRWLIDDTVCIP